MQSDEPARRAVVLVEHGGVPGDYPRDRLMQLRGLESRRQASGSRPSGEEVALENELRHWPRTPPTELVADGVTDIVAMPSMFTPGGVHAEIEIPRTIGELRAEIPHITLHYAWPFAGEQLTAFFVEHLRQFNVR